MRRPRLAKFGVKPKARISTSAFKNKRMGISITESAFYLDCVQNFHEEAKKHGVATKGVIAVPGLMPYGEKYAGDYLTTPPSKLVL